MKLLQEKVNETCGSNPVRTVFYRVQTCFLDHGLCGDICLGQVCSYDVNFPRKLDIFFTDHEGMKE